MTGRSHYLLFVIPFALNAAAIAPFLCCTPNPQPAEPPPRALARSAILTIADGVRVADALCGPLAKERVDLALAEACSEEYHNARAALVAAERALDEGADVPRAACATLPAVRALESMTRLISSSSAPAIDDAFSMALRLSSAYPCQPKDAQ